MRTLAGSVFRCVASRNKRKDSPAPGNRGYGEGALWSVGNSGYGWSSTSYGSGDHYRGMYLGFNVTWLHPSTAYYRCHGFQLRCLSE